MHGLVLYSYVAILLIAPGWTTADSPNEAQLKALGDKMSTTIKAIHDKSYTSQKSIELYKTTGTASDWSGLMIAGTTSKSFILY